ncbi:hypothetical protein H6G89_18655 [Oscillatoria sp. FACHB-1407]|uniref:hypothetical protein n=1 Tax=Oscillatoria sp. FACHB-1407 TaxID=2692847 RepID=UPI001685CAF1|nr:hypothetical protein [Oscillatoria sp. FACHB-1407]MBD2463061.1 hypothetical protein [Oscillatoria sp. FACHB-1407]
MSLVDGMNALPQVQGNHQILTILLVQLEEVEEQIEGLQHTRLELLKKISMGCNQMAVK